MSSEHRSRPIKSTSSPELPAPSAITAPVVLRREGDASKPNPFTICIVANPALEAPWQSGLFVPDPIMTDQSAFDQAVDYIDDALFGKLPNQAEQLLADPQIEPKVRVITLFDTTRPADDANCLVGEDDGGMMLVTRPTLFAPFLASYGLEADVVYAVSASEKYKRASAYYTSDDDGRPGEQFKLNGTTLYHRHYAVIPGTIAIHVSAYSLTAVHEFGHALSSYTNGQVVDLYADSNWALNNMRGRPIPSAFATYNGTPHQTDPNRGGLGYPTGWMSYHCELLNKSPALMDNYWQEPRKVPERCAHDRITRAFLRDRVLAKTRR